MALFQPSRGGPAMRPHPHLPAVAPAATRPSGRAGTSGARRKPDINNLIPDEPHGVIHLLHENSFPDHMRDEASGLASRPWIALECRTIELEFEYENTIRA